MDQSRNKWILPSLYKDPPNSRLRGCLSDAQQILHLNCASKLGAKVESPVPKDKAL